MIPRNFVPRSNSTTASVWLKFRASHQFLFVRLVQICVTSLMILSCSQALVIPEKFQHILRVLNTNIDGKQKIMFALTSIKVSKESIVKFCVMPWISVCV